MTDIDIDQDPVIYNGHVSRHKGNIISTLLLFTLEGELFLDIIVCLILAIYTYFD